MQRYYDREGNPIGQEEWFVAFETADRILAQDRINGHYVSTVWLGLNHRFGEGSPLIFETMIFCEHGPPQRLLGIRWNNWFFRTERNCPFDNLQWRYSTEEEAYAGHESAVFRLHQKGKKYRD